MKKMHSLEVEVEDFIVITTSSTFMFTTEDISIIMCPRPIKKYFPIITNIPAERLSEQLISCRPRERVSCFVD